MLSLVYFTRVGDILVIENFVKEHNLIKVEGWNDYYINNLGEVYSYKNKYRSRKGWKKLKPEVINKYLYVNFVDGNKKKRYAVHRLIAQYFCEGYSDGLVVNHIDGNCSNNHYTNLEWVTQRENVVKSYSTSNVNQVRNYKLYQLVYKDGTIDKNVFKGSKEFCNYVDSLNLGISTNSLMVYGSTKGYTFIKYDKK